MEAIHMQFFLLGALEVVRDSQPPLPLGGLKKRAVLALLLLNANTVVASSRLMKSLWVGDAPPTGRKMLQNAVSELRGLLAEAGGGPDVPALMTHPPGYLLRVDPTRIDSCRFLELAQRGRAEIAAEDWGRARHTLRQALAMWRGPILTDLAETGIDWPELVAMRNARLDALEDLFEAELACGRHRDVVGELEPLVRSEPSRERLAAQLMLALYRCGRQLDALGVYRDARSALIEQHGLEPSREAQELERSILNHDPALDWRSQAPPRRPGAVTTAEARRVSRRQQVSVMAVVTDLAEDPLDENQQVLPALGALSDVVRTAVARHHGAVIGNVAATTWAVFGDDAGGDPPQARAACAAIEARDALRDGRVAAGIMNAKIAVVTAPTLVSYDPHVRAPVGLSGGAIDQCLRLAALSPPGAVRVCERTRAGINCWVGYGGVADTKPAWETTELLGQADRRVIDPLPQAIIAF
jgi:DNA-binding SARP family transcriptional activator